MMSLPLLSYTLVQNSQDNMVARGFGTAATLLVLVLVLFAIARVIGGRGAGQLTARQQRRRTARSRRDAVRYRNRSAAATTVPVFETGSA